MRKLETEPLYTYGQTSLDIPCEFDVLSKNGTTLSYDDVISQTPAVISSYDGFDSPQLAIQGESTLPIWDETADYSVGRLNADHGRNLEVLSPEVHIEDVYGNRYSSLCIKGTDFSNPHIFESQTAARKYIIYGLQESLVIERVIKASQMLREQGIGTEYICGLVAPVTFPIAKDQNGFDSTDTVSFADFYERLAIRYATEQTDGRPAIEHKKEMLEKFSDCEYVVTYRGMDIPYRLSEVGDESTFKRIKTYILDRGMQVPENFISFSLDEYLQHIVVPNLALNFSKMHDIGLVHNFPHKGNISALGSLLDLDSCSGEPLGIGDKKITEQDIYHEILYACTSLYEMTPEQESYEQYGSEHSRHTTMFLSRYLSNRYNDDDKAIKEFLIKMTDYKIRHQNDDRIHFEQKDSGPYMVTRLVLDVLKQLSIEIIEDESVEGDESSEGLWEQFIQRTVESPVSLIPPIVYERLPEITEEVEVDEEDNDIHTSVLDQWTTDTMRIGHMAFMQYLIEREANDDILTAFALIHKDILDYNVVQEDSVKTEHMAHELSICMIAGAKLIYGEALSNFVPDEVRNYIKKNPDYVSMMSQIGRAHV